MLVRNYIERWKNRKYLQRIFLFVTVIMMGLMFISIFTIQHYAEKTIAELQKEEDSKTLNQINYNINMMNEMVRTTAVQIFTNPEYFSLLYADEYTDSFSLLRKVDSFKRVSASATFLHSAMIYNGVQERYFAYRPLGSTRASNQSVLDYFLDQSAPILRLEPVYSESHVEYFMMAYFDPWERRAAHNSAVLLTVEPEWLFDNVEMMNEIGGQAAGQTLFLLSEEGKLFTTQSAADTKAELFRPLILEYIQEAGQTEGFFITKAGGEKYIVSFLTAQQVGWKIITVQSYDQLVGSLETLRRNTLYIASILVLVALLLSVIVSLRIYRPIDKAVAQFRGNDYESKEHTPGLKDEIKFMAHRYREMINQNFHLKHNVAKNYLLSRMIADSTAYSLGEMNSLIADHHLQLGSQRPYVLIIFRLDHYNRILKNKKPSELGLYKFAVANISKDMLSGSHLCEVVDVGQDHLAAIVHLSSESMDESGFQDVAKEINRVVQHYYKLTLTIAVSPVMRSFDQLTEAYKQTLHLSHYRLSLGHSSFITFQKIESNVGNEALHYSPELESKLFERLKETKVEECEDILDHIFRHISHLSYDNMIQSVLHLVHKTNEFIFALNELKLMPFRTDIKSFYQEVLEKETLAEIQVLFVSFVQEACEGLKSDLSNKNLLLINRVKQLIVEQFHNPDLNLDYAATELKMSPGHLSKLFKQSENISIIDHINEVRLAHTLHLLEHSEFSIKEIMGHAGYSSESYFYRLFKKKYGVTPKQYQLKKSIDTHPE